MNDKTVLVIEDDKSIGNFLKISLKTNNYRYIIAENGLSGISLFLSNNPDLILLDLGLPDIDGLEVLKQIRINSDIPVIIISARGQEKEKIAALDSGADDYITKPFNIGELLARIRVALRRYIPKFSENDIFQLHSLKVDFQKRKVFIEENEIHLTPLEYKMLELLINNSGKVLTHKYIQEKVWGYASMDDYQSVRVFMANIRRKIEDDTSNPKYIITEVGVGYRFVEE
jgi:two-component system KDP operon response regulator KdpE